MTANKKYKTQYKYKAKKRAEWKAAGLCWCCGKKPTEGYKTCEKARKANTESRRKAREQKKEAVSD